MPCATMETHDEGAHTHMSSGWNDQNQGGGPGSGPYDPRYGQSPHYPQGQPGPTYGQAQYGQQQPYATPPGHPMQPVQQPWAQGESLYGNPYAHAMPPAMRSDMLGIVGLGMVFVATVVLIVVSWMGGQSFGQFILDTEAAGVYAGDDLASDPLTMAYLQSATGLVFGAIGACVAGLVGWVISIVATVQRRGRGFGVVGIILGVLSTGIAFLVFFAGILPVLGYDG